METEEHIKVYIRIKNGKTVCICHRNQKGCTRHCDKDIVTRDKYEGWKETMCNRYGQ